MRTYETGSVQNNWTRQKRKICNWIKADRKNMH